MMTPSAIALRPARLYADAPIRSIPMGWPGSILEVEFDPATSSVWARLAPTAPVYVSLELLREFAQVSDRVREGRYGTVKFKIISSRIPRVFSLGGDLALFLHLINARDRSGLVEYAKAAIDEVWANVTGCGSRELTTLALVDGEAQGGGFEAALSCHVIVAERGANFGFPESLFGLFPGMGAGLLLAARTDEAVAARLISSANRYTADFLHEIGVVDYVVPPGTGMTFVKSLMETPDVPLAVKRKAQLERINFNALLSSVEAWVDTALGLSDKHKRSMSYLLNAQRRVA